MIVVITNHLKNNLKIFKYANLCLVSDTISFKYATNFHNMCWVSFAKTEEKIMQFMQHAVADVLLHPKDYFFFLIFLTFI